MLPLNQVVEGDCLAVMREFPEESIDFIQFSPPYWGLRNYGESTETVWGGDPDCKHEWIEERMTLVHENRNFQKGTQEEVHGEKPTTYIKKYDDQVAGFCVKCGAWKGQLGLEPSWQMYVEHMVTVCRELKRVLKRTGSMYIVLGDTYAGSHCAKGDSTLFQNQKRKKVAENLFSKSSPQADITDYQPKCLMGIPWRVAFALIEELQLILRNDIIWHKPNAMPSSVKDRLTQTYEHIFHFVKNRKYYYNLDAIREPHQTSSLKRAGISGVVPFNLRVRDVKRGKKGLYVEGGKVKQLKASQKEVESYIYPEKSLGLETLKVYCLQEYDKATKKRMAYDHKGGLEAPASFKSASDWNRGTRASMNAIINSLNISESIKSKLRTWWHDHQGHPKGKNPGDTILTKHDVAVHRFPTVNREGGLGYTDPLHVKAYHEKGKNPGDVFQTKKEPYVGNNPHRMRLQKEQFLALDASRPMDLSHPKGKNPGDVVKWAEVPGQAQQGNFGHGGTHSNHFNHPEGKNPGDYWNICTKPFKGAHFAVYPEEICLKPILSSCPPNGIVLDPMCGSGTTLAVAKKLGRGYIGIEINPKYVDIATQRLLRISPLNPLIS